MDGLATLSVGYILRHDESLYSTEGKMLG